MTALEREVRRIKEERSAGRAFRRQQEAEALAEERKGADALIEEVVEVNEVGQSKLARVRDRGTNAVSLVEMVGGYRPPSGVKHEYDPVARGLGNGGDNERS
jgi:hypothetical protein